MNVFIVQVDYDAPPHEVPPETPLVFADLRAAKAHCQAEVREFGSGGKLRWLHSNHRGDPVRTWWAEDKKRGQPTASFFISTQDLPTVPIDVARRAWSFLVDVACADYFAGEAEYDEMVAELERELQ